LTASQRRRSELPRFQKVIDIDSSGKDVIRTRFELSLSDCKPEYEQYYRDTPVSREKLPFLIYLGIGRRWDGPVRDGPCPICGGRPLGEMEYCLMCDRSGRDSSQARPPRRPQRAPLRRQRKRARQRKSGA
jgi:hypothetical protein